MRRETIILCVGCRARVERETPGRWAWSEAPSGLRCGAEGCDRRADALGTLQVHPLAGRTADPAVVEKRAAKLRGQRRTAEQRERMRVAQQARQARRRAG
jgi:hypothetical protein